MIVGAVDTQAELLIRHGPEQEIVLARVINGSIWVVTGGERVLWNASKLPKWERTFPDPDNRDKGIGVKVLAEVDGRLWIGTDQGIFEIGNGTYFKKSLDSVLDETRVRFAKQDQQGSVWIGTDASVYFQKSRAASAGEVFRKSATDRTLELLEVIGDEIYVGTESRLVMARLGANNEPGKFKTVPGTEHIVGPVKELIKINSSIYLSISGGEERCLYRLSGEELEKLACSVISLKAIENELWYSTSADVETPEGDRFENFVGRCRRCDGGFGDLGIPGRDIIKEEVDSIDYVNDYVWFCTSEGIFRWKKDTLQRFEPLVVKRKVENSDIPYPFAGVLQEKDGTVWAWGSKGLYRLYEKARIKVAFNAFTLPRNVNVHVLFDGGFRILDASYDQDGRNPFADIDGNFAELMVVGEGGKNFRDKVERPQEFSRLGSNVLDSELGSLYSILNIAIRDRFGNVLLLTDQIVFIDHTLKLVRQAVGFVIIVCVAVFAIWQPFWTFPRCFGLLLLIWVTRVPGLRSAHDRLLVNGRVRRWLRYVYIGSVKWPTGNWGKQSRGALMVCRLLAAFSVASRKREVAIFNIAIDEPFVRPLLRAMAYAISRAEDTAEPWVSLVPVVVKAFAIARDVTGSNFLQAVVVRQMESVGWCLDRRAFGQFVELGSCAVLLHVDGADGDAMKEIRAFAEGIRSAVVLVSRSTICGASELIDLRGVDWGGAD